MSQIPTEETVDATDVTKNAVIEKDPSTGKSFVKGDGIFDDLMETFTKHLDTQFTNGYLRGEDYTQAYLTLMANALSASVQLALQKPISEAQVDSEKAKEALYIRQAKGFDDEAKTKVLNIALQTWALAYTSAAATSELQLPLTLAKDTIDNMVVELIGRSNLGSQADGKIQFITEPYLNTFSVNPNPNP